MWSGGVCMLITTNTMINGKVQIGNKPDAVEILEADEDRTVFIFHLEANVLEDGVKVGNEFLSHLLNLIQHKLKEFLLFVVILVYENDKLDEDVVNIAHQDLGHKTSKI